MLKRDLFKEPLSQEYQKALAVKEDMFGVSNFEKKYCYRSSTTITISSDVEDGFEATDEQDNQISISRIPSTASNLNDLCAMKSNNLNPDIL